MGGQNYKDREIRINLCESFIPTKNGKEASALLIIFHTWVHSHAPLSSISATKFSCWGPKFAPQQKVGNDKNRKKHV